MHDGPDHHHPHHHHSHHDHHPHAHGPAPRRPATPDGRPPALGHNAPPREPVAWQLPDPARGEAALRPGSPEPDVDLVEAAFLEGFSAASDPTSFLRLAGVPFRARDAAGRSLCLLRVELEEKVDVGAVAPLLGGAGFRYDPLPARLVSRRRSLSFVYAEGSRTVRLGLAAARALSPDPSPGEERP